MILLMQTNTVLNCLHTTSEVCEMCIKIFYVAQAITSLYKKVKEYSQIKATLKCRRGYSSRTEQNNLLKRMGIFSKSIFSSIKCILAIMWFIWISIRNNHLNKAQPMCYRSTSTATINISNRIDNQTLFRGEANTEVPLP